MKPEEILLLKDRTAVRIESRNLEAEGTIKDMTPDGTYVEVTLTRIDSQRGNEFSVGETHGFPTRLVAPA